MGNGDEQLPDPTGAVTIRQRFELMEQNPACGGCHRSMDPIGFAFEGFDGVGRVQTKDDGLPIDTSGDFAGKHFADSKELLETLVPSDDVSACLVKQMYRNAVGRQDAALDQDALTSLSKTYQTSDHALLSLVTTIATGGAFRFLPKGAVK